MDARNVVNNVHMRLVLVPFLLLASCAVASAAFTKSYLVRKLNKWLGVAVAVKGGFVINSTDGAALAAKQDELSRMSVAFSPNSNPDLVAFVVNSHSNPFDTST